MPSAELVGYSNLALYSAMAVFTVSMLIFAAYLAALGPVRRAASKRRSRSRSRRERLGGYARRGRLGGRPRSPRRPTRCRPSGAGVRSAGGRAPARARKTGNIALHLGWLGDPAARRLGRDARARGHALAAGQHVRVRDGGARGCPARLLACRTRRGLRWLGLFVTGPVLLSLGWPCAVSTPRPPS